MALKRYLAMSYADIHALNSIQEVADRLKWLYPEKAQYVGDEVLYRIVRQGIAKAQEWGLPPRPGNALCAGLFFFIGSGCDHDPLRPWIEDYTRREMSPGNKAHKIFESSHRMVRLEFKTRELTPEQQRALEAYAILKPLTTLDCSSLPRWYPETTLAEAVSVMHPGITKERAEECTYELFEYIPEPKAR